MPRSSLDQFLADSYVRFQSETMDPEMTLSTFAAELSSLVRGWRDELGDVALRALKLEDLEALAQTISEPNERKVSSVADRLASYTRWLEGGN